MEQLETLQCMPLHVQDERISVRVFIGKLNRSLYWHFFSPLIFLLIGCYREDVMKYHSN